MSAFPKIEVYRRGVGLVAEDGGESLAISVDAGRSRPLRSCGCNSGRRTCQHQRDLSSLVRNWKIFLAKHRASDWEELFSASVWYRLAYTIHAAEPIPFDRVEISWVTVEDRVFLRFSSPKGELARYYGGDPGRQRLLERLGKSMDGTAAGRAALLEKLTLFQMRPDEREMQKLDVKSQGQVWEETFWYRLAYHCARELPLTGERIPEDGTPGTFHPAIDKKTGNFNLAFRPHPGLGTGLGTLPEDGVLCQITVPRKRVHAALKLLAEVYPKQADLDIHPVPLKSLFLVGPDTRLDLDVRPKIRALQASGQPRFFARKDLKKFTYGQLLYIPEMGILTELARGDSKQRRFTTPIEMKLQKSQVPNFLQSHREAVEDARMILDEPLRGLRIYSEYDYVEMSPETTERSWYELSVRYGFGNMAISLRDILVAQRAGMPYLETPRGWIDLQSGAFEHLTELSELVDPDDKATGLRLSASQLLRLKAQSGGRPVHIAERRGGRSEILKRLLELQPARSYEQPEGFLSTLRAYQVHGVEWLHFLHENRLGGLLCDDMGLGKTHQAMALMVTLREQQGVDGSLLVACPTSVMSHWRNKIRDFAPGLKVVVHHGQERNLSQAIELGNVIVTSYGILRNDLEELRRQHFALAIFDEIQYLKNRDTLSYKAAQALTADVKVGLTGTPIENALIELKALFDLVLPGYFGSDESFQRRYVQSVEENGHDSPSIDELKRLINPFVLRRRKVTVLDELPEKIEDLRTCTLSDDQVALYRDALDNRGKTLIADLEADDGRPVPYIHIFALLNLLKQICDHPALALGEIDRAADYKSGKWDLYREILRECLDSGLKVVVFTQYLGMIELMRHDLDELGVEYAVLTGTSTDRGDIVDTFNEDEDCRVFLGSLKAGGTGIDLVGGSVVIHYDRWWNAAREDQATDRVHRIGQKRAVQVFKLVTEGTLEEKIAAIIEQKRQLMEHVVEEDDPRLAKFFTRDELLGMLAQV